MQVLSLHRYIAIITEFLQILCCFLQPSHPNTEVAAECPVQHTGCPAAYPTDYFPQPSTLSTTPTEIESQPIMESQPENEPPPPYSNLVLEEVPLQDFPPQTN